MSTTEIIIVCLMAGVGIAIIAFTVYQKFKKKEVLLPELSQDEKDAVAVSNQVLSLSNPTHKLYVVRNPSDKITILSNLTWAELETTLVKSPAKGFTYREINTIFIRRYNDTLPFNMFVRLYIHETMHIIGYEHGEKMTTDEITFTKEIFNILKDKGYDMDK